MYFWLQKLRGKLSFVAETNKDKKIALELNVEYILNNIESFQAYYQFASLFNKPIAADFIQFITNSGYLGIEKIQWHSKQDA